jgi:hypothetical protein
MSDLYVGTAIFLVAYAVIITEKVHKTVVAPWAPLSCSSSRS